MLFPSFLSSFIKKCTLSSMSRKIVTHKSCDLDGITSVWLLKRFLPGWENAEIEFVPAGSKLPGNYVREGEEIEVLGGIETIHVDTGMGKLDHHQLDDDDECAASLTLKFVLAQPNNALSSNKHKTEAVKRIVNLVIDVDHFQEVFYPDPLSDIYELSLVGILDGFRFLHPKEDGPVCEYGMELLDNSLSNFENRIWAEEEIKEKGVEFETKFGKGIVIESPNDEVLKIAQKMGYVITLRRDPKHGNIRIKTRPIPRKEWRKSGEGVVDIDLTPVYQKLKEKESDATWFLHVSKRMLLNGSSKNPTMTSSRLTIPEVIEIIKEAYA